MKQYIGIVRDHSASMSGLRSAATQDYNQNVAALQEGAAKTNIDSIVSVVECGVGVPTDAPIHRAVTNSNLRVLKAMSTPEYRVDGQSTPLFDSVGDLIELMRTVPDSKDPGVSFLVMVITDGYENSSKNWTARTLKSAIDRMTATDRWTFTFRVPRGHAGSLASLGIPRENILEWEQSAEGFMAATMHTQTAIGNFYAQRASGQTMSRSFYTDLSGVAETRIKRNLADISEVVSIWPVREQTEIRPFVEGKLKRPMRMGAAFYELNKPESHVQDYKKIVIRDRDSEKVYAGPDARVLLQLPAYGDIRLTPGNHGKYDIFVQSNSVNRKLYPGTRVLYWENQ